MNTAIWEMIKDACTEAEMHHLKLRELYRLFACKKCSGRGQVDLSREPCSTAEIDCPECDGKGYA